MTEFRNKVGEQEGLVICRCEEITETEIRSAIRDGRHSVAAVKKATRAGMGVCQGRTCERIIEKILKEEGVNLPRADKSRFPIVPCPVSSFVDCCDDEVEAAE